MSRSELFEVVEDMIEHMGVQAFTEEVMHGMSTDELKETVEHIDQHHFANHFLK
tara:strand:- start:891 stop:1052 length:162 start_codon:yes stop_codon:yes gene_type:complete